MRTGKKQIVVYLVIVILCSAAIAYAFGRVNAGVFRMPVAAMEPTIKAGESFRTDMSAFKSADPQRWDLVVFRSPQKEGQVWVFRVVGMPGETISFGNVGLLINGQTVDLPDHLGNISYSGLAVDVPAVEHPFVVPPFGYYVLGDNPDKANDSRVWGALAREHVLGKVDDR